MIAAFALIAGAAQGTAPAPLFDAFKAACGDIGRFDRVEPTALAAGWVRVADKDADPRIVRIVTRGNAAATGEQPGAKVTGQLFRHRLDGRDVWLATSRVEFQADGKPAWANGCRAYDLDAPSAPTIETASTWVGRAPTGSQSSGNATKLQWSPWQPDTALEITYVPRDNPLGSQFGIQGLILVSQAIGGF